MGLKIRRVPKDWQHPTDGCGHYLPLADGAEFSKWLTRWDEGAQKWAEGLCCNFNGWDINDEWIPLTEEQKGKPYSWWDGERPDPKDYMPLWSDEERTHLIMYETSTPGTPISPAFATAEELARWLADNNALWSAGETASYEQWLSMIEKMISGHYTESARRWLQSKRAEAENTQASRRCSLAESRA